MKGVFFFFAFIGGNGFEALTELTTFFYRHWGGKYECPLEKDLVEYGSLWKNFCADNCKEPSWTMKISSD